jgi:predicted permease
VHSLRAKDSGFDPARVLLLNVDASSLPATRLDALHEELVDGVRAMPGVTAVAASTMTPLGMRVGFRGLHLPGLPETAEARGVFSNVVSEDYFRTLGIRILRGRAFAREDGPGARAVAILNEQTALYIFGHADPIGRTIAWANAPDNPLEVIGVAEDSSQENLRDNAPRMVYTPMAQGRLGPQHLQLAVKTTDVPAAMASPVRQLITRLGPDIVVTQVRTMADQIDGTIVRERSLSGISIVFAALASLLACVGIYGVMSYQVARRTREIGIRLALGAPEGSIFRGVIRQTLALALTGIAIGIAGALIGTQTIAAHLYGVTPRDPLTLASVGVALGVTALAAGYLPARRAARIGPLRAIRTE